MNRRDWLAKMGGATAGALMTQLAGTGNGLAVREPAKRGVDSDTGRWRNDGVYRRSDATV